MENESKQRNKRNRRRERAHEMKQERQRQAQQQNNEAGSGEDEETTPPPSNRARERPRHRQRRRKPSRSRSSSNEEEIIDGFAISAYASLEDLENEGNKAKPQRQHKEDNGDRKTNRTHKNNVLRQNNSANRGNEVNGTTRLNSHEQLSDASSHSRTGSGYMCDSESEGDRVSETGSDIFSSSAATTRRDLLTNVTNISTQTNGGPSPETTIVSESNPKANLPQVTGLVTTTVTSSTISATVSVLTISERQQREESIQTSPPVEVQASQPAQEIRDKERERELERAREQDRERERHQSQERVRQKELERKRERERASCYSRGGNGWQSHPNQLSASVGHQGRPPSHHPPYALPGSLPGYTPQPTLAPQPNPHSMFSPPGLRPPTPLTSTALPMPTPGGSSTPFGSGSSSDFGYPVKGNQQELLRQELNSRFIASQNRHISSLNPLPYMRQETHMHQHMHQHQHTHSFLPPPAPMIPAPSHQILNLGTPAPPPPQPAPPPSVPVLPPSSISSGLGSSGHGAFQPKVSACQALMWAGMSVRRDKPGKWCAAHVNVAWLIHHQQQKMKVESHKESLLKPDLFGKIPGSHLFSPHRQLDPHMQPGLFPHATAGLTHSPHPGTHHSALLAPGNGQFPLPPMPKPTGYSPLSPLGLPPGTPGKPPMGSGLMNGREMLGLSAIGSNQPAHWSRLHRNPPSFGPWSKPESDKPKDNFHSEFERIKEEERHREREKEKQLELERQRDRERNSTFGNSESRKEEAEHRLSVQNHDRGQEHVERDPRLSHVSKMADSRLSSGVRTSPSRFPHDLRPPDPHSIHRDPRLDSAFINVFHSNPLFLKDDRRDFDKERLAHHEHMHPTLGLHPSFSLMERNRLVEPPPGSMVSPFHHLDPTYRPHTAGPHLDPFGGRLHQMDQLHHREHSRPDILEFERDRILRASLQPMGPLIDSERFRDREPHDFTRDNPLMLRRIDHAQHMAHFMEERERLFREEAERSRIFHGDTFSLGMMQKHLGAIPPTSSHFPFSRTSSMYPLLGLKNGTPPTSQPPPPLISSLTPNGIVPPFQMGSRPHSRSISPPRIRELKHESSGDHNHSSSREKATPDIKEDTAR